jgi:hypothetical protein
MFGGSSFALESSQQLKSPAPALAPPSQVPASLRLFEGKTHTDLLLEDAFKGGPDALTDAILEVVTGRPHTSDHARMVPRPLVWLAARACPF